MRKWKIYKASIGLGIASLFIGSALSAVAAPLPGGTLDPLTIPKFVTPLVIPPVMPTSSVQPGSPRADYNIAVRQFSQQILPGGIWDTVADPTDIYPNFPATTVWSYGRAEDPLPDSSGLGGGVGIAPAPNSTFNYPAFTFEEISGVMNSVRWINDLVDPATGNYLPHLFAVDQNLHWANPPQTCIDGSQRTDCVGVPTAEPYTGPVPIVTHVHGAHVNMESDGYPESWWLPNANNIPAGYASHGTLFDQYNRRNRVPGSAFYAYENDQPAATLWYHDHSLGMTRLNVYAGPAGFWNIRGGAYDLSAPQLPGPAPMEGDAILDLNAPASIVAGSIRDTIREIPIVIQDRSFNQDGSLFYPNNRAFFEGLNVPGEDEQIPESGTYEIPLIPESTSDIAPIWNPEAFFNTMVVNGSTWPSLQVAPALYRFRLLDGCNSRFLNLAMFIVTDDGADGVPGTEDDTLGAEVPFYQIGAEQGFLPQVVRIETGMHTVYDGTPGGTALSRPADQALLMGPAERADVLVDFRGLAEGTRIRMINTGPDSPFGGFPVGEDQADLSTTGQVMEFKVDTAIFGASPTDTTAIPPDQLVLPAEPALNTPINNTRQLSLNEEVSSQVCVSVDSLNGTTTEIILDPGQPFEEACADAGGFPAGPKAALLGTVDTDQATGISSSTPLRWMAPLTELPIIGDTEEWEIFNLTMDAHPIHLHLVRFELIDRQPLLIDPLPDLFGDPITLPEVDTAIDPVGRESTEAGFKDTVIAYPGEVTRIKAHFDRAGLYVWHCHIVEHEDNEMMRPYVVRYDPEFPDFDQNGRINGRDLAILLREIIKPKPRNPGFDLNGDGDVNLKDIRTFYTAVLNLR